MATPESEILIVDIEEPHAELGRRAPPGVHQIGVSGQQFDMGVVPDLLTVPGSHCFAPRVSDSRLNNLALVTRRRRPSFGSVLFTQISAGIASTSSDPVRCLAI